MDKVAKHIVFVGQVQGVGFRFTAFRVANNYGFTGQVRNLADGTVEMIAQGAAGDIDKCVRDIKKSFVNYITETRIKEIPANPQYKDFKITF